MIDVLYSDYTLALGSWLKNCGLSPGLCEGTGKGGCGDEHSQNNYLGARSRYVTNVSTSNPYYAELTSSEVQNAYHVFLTGGTWVPNDIIGHPDIPDSLDCIYVEVVVLQIWDVVVLTPQAALLLIMQELMEPG